MSEPQTFNLEGRKAVRFGRAFDQFRIAEWMEMEAQDRKLDEAERQVEEDARALEQFIRRLAQSPQRLLLQRPRLEQEALQIRDRREGILRAREEIDKKRRRFWEKTPDQNRVGMSVRVSETSEHNFYTGICGDIEAGGLFIATRDNHPPGTLVDLALSLPGQPPLQMVGEVRWMREYNEFTADMEPGLGVGFLRLTEEARRAIAAFVEIRPPLLYEME